MSTILLVWTVNSNAFSMQNHHRENTRQSKTSRGLEAGEYSYTSYTTDPIDYYHHEDGMSEEELNKLVFWGKLTYSSVISIALRQISKALDKSLEEKGWPSGCDECYLPVFVVITMPFTSLLRDYMYGKVSFDSLFEGLKSTAERLAVSRMMRNAQ